MTGLRIDIKTLTNRLAKIKRAVEAKEFKPEVEDFTKNTMVTCIEITPVRDEELIKENQRTQYEHRINYIPSVHDLQRATLIVKPDGEHLFIDGKWYRPDKWKLKPEIWSEYQRLKNERERRINRRGEEAFISDRTQARFLYSKTWLQVAQSLGLSIPVDSRIAQATSRRNPKKNPPKAYGRMRGGKYKLSVAVLNPFLKQPSRYKDFDGTEILAKATEKNKPAFMRAVEKKLREIIRNGRR